MFNQLFRFDNLANFVGLFVGVFSLLTIIYSIGFMKGKKGLVRYYLYMILTCLASLGAVFTKNFILFMVFWGFLGFLLYLLIGFGQNKRSSYTAKKTFIIIGGTDAFMLLGLALVFYLSGTLQMDKISIGFDSKLAVWAYLCLAIGAFAKAGVMPFHTWIPDTAEDAPTPVTAFLPASLDKLLGIYFLYRISIEMFQMNQAMNTMLLAVGSFTIVAAVMMALVQHDLKRLLGYHAVSQVGYMVLGIGTANPVGIAGGLFHMLNHAIYKACLFLSSGSVENKTKTTDLEKLGGFAKTMPITFVTFLIASLAISGVPPLNGFASKWMIYQGVLKTAKSGGSLWIIWLTAAIFGSALTLASFMKLIHAVFLGQPSDEAKILNSHVKESSFTMWVPQIILAGLCVIFGVFAYSLPLKLFIFPSVSQDISIFGLWNANVATALILTGVIIGVAIYLLGNGSSSRETEVFIGGELLKDNPRIRVSGTKFYNTISDIAPLAMIYKMAKNKAFDIYEIGTKITFAFTGVLRFIHNGVLSTYLAWCLLGMGILFYILLR